MCTKYVFINVALCIKGSSSSACCEGMILTIGHCLLFLKKSGRLAGIRNNSAETSVGAAESVTYLEKRHPYKIESEILLFKMY